MLVNECKNNAVILAAVKMHTSGFAQGPNLLLQISYVEYITV